MKKNTFTIDNRAEWQMKRIMHENKVTDEQFANLSHYKGINSEVKSTDHPRSIHDNTFDSIKNVIDWALHLRIPA